MADEYQLAQHIKDLTWITNNSTTCIDLIYSSHPEKLSQSGVVTIGFSDHDVPKREDRHVWIRNYKNYNVQSFNGYLWQLPWSVINVFEDAQVMWDMFVSLFTEAVDKHAPWMHKMIKGLDTPYITGELRKHMQDRDVAKSRASKSHDTVLWDKYKKLSNKVTSLTEKAKQDYDQNLLAENMHKLGDLWKAFKKVLLASNKENATLLCDDDDEHATLISIANCYNNFVSKIGSNLAAAFPSGFQIVNPYPNVNTTFSFQEIPVDFILKQLHLLNSEKSTGFDNINSHLLKDSAEVVAGSLKAIMNASLTSGELPNIW